MVRSQNLGSTGLESRMLKACLHRIGAALEPMDSVEVAFLSGRLSSLPQPSVRGVRIADFDLVGRLGPSLNAETADLLLQRLSARIGDRVKVELFAEYEHAGQESHGKFPSVVSVRVLQKQLSLYYTAGGSVVAREQAAGRAFFERVMSETGVPLRVKVDEAGFSLADLAGRQIRTPVSEAGGRNPSAFVLDLPGRTVDEAVGCLRAWVELFARDGARWSWRVTLTPHATDEDARSAVRTVSEASLAAPFELAMAVVNSETGCFDFFGDLVRAEGSLRLESGKVRLWRDGPTLQFGASRRDRLWTLRTRARPEDKEVLERVLGITLTA